jgi:hypothetical protein
MALAKTVIVQWYSETPTYGPCAEQPFCTLNRETLNRGYIKMEQKITPFVIKTLAKCMIGMI